MALDADIAGAATALDLDKIKAQDYRNDLKARLPLAQTMGAQYTGYVDALETAASGLLTREQELRRDIVRAIAVNYMKPTTGTLPATIDADTANDVARLRAAVNAVFDLVWNG